MSRFSRRDASKRDCASGLVHLQKLKKLALLRFKNTKVTDAGIVSLEKHLPKAKIER